jgi:hypothetical protein
LLGFAGTWAGISHVDTNGSHLLSKADACSSSVFIDEFDPGRLQRALNRLHDKGAGLNTLASVDRMALAALSATKPVIGSIPRLRETIAGRPGPATHLTGLFAPGLW